LLAAFGILAFVLVFSESIAVLLFPVKSMVVTGVAAILFEIIIGLWLLIKGVNISNWTLYNSIYYSIETSHNVPSLQSTLAKSEKSMRQCQHDELTN
jgi:hypothetical protein